MDENTVLVPDQLGNNRPDILGKFVEGPRASLLFRVPGVGETLRINGNADIYIDTDLCASFAVTARRPEASWRLLQN